MNSTDIEEQIPTTFKRLWVISEVYYPEETSTGYYLTKIAEGLADSFIVKVLCGQPNYSIRGTKAPKSEMRNNVAIFRAAGTTFDRRVNIYRLINMFTLGISMLWHGIRRFNRGDKVLVVTTPPSMPFIIAIASLFRGASYVLLIHDLYPEVLVAVGRITSGSVIVRTVDFFNRWLYKHASKIIVVGRDMKDVVEAKSRGLSVPIEFIPNWAETDTVRPQPRRENRLIDELGLQDKFIILHAGNIGHPTDIETVIDCLRVLDDRFHFVFVGTGVKQKQLDIALKDQIIRNLTLLGSRPRAQQIEFLNACDVGLVSLVKGMYGAAMPSKTYNIMAAGKPILAITDEGSELARVIEEEQIGWQVLSNDGKELAAILENIFEYRDNLASMGVRARAAAEKSYSLEIALENYRKALS